MELNLERPLLFFDIESTGLNISTDGIIELSFVKVMPDNTNIVKTWKVKPWNYAEHCQIPINPSAAAVNGVADEDLKDCPRFIEVASEVAAMLKGSDLAGYNSTKFDLPMLSEEFERVKAYCRERIADPAVPQSKKDLAKQMMADIDIDLHEATMIDVQTIYHFMEPRNLKAAYRFYTGKDELENAHTAEADTIATYEVLKGQLDMYKEADKHHSVVLKNNVKYLSEIGGRPKSVDYAGRIAMIDNVPTISFGKYRGKSVKEIFEKDRSYFSWIYAGDFTLDTKAQFRKLEEKYKEEAKAREKQAPSEDALVGLMNKFNTKK